MPLVGPISRRDLIKSLRELGFDGPSAGRRHDTMSRGTTVIWIPNRHGGDISTALLLRVLKQAGISRDEWEAL
jgi:hypothetical protein